MPIRVFITDASTADCQKASCLIEGIDAGSLLADRAYDTNKIIEQVQSRGIKLVIPPKKNRIVQREYDHHLYRLRHLIENCFLALKRWRGVATRYAKNTKSFLAVVKIRCLAIWAKVF